MTYGDNVGGVVVDAVDSKQDGGHVADDTPDDYDIVQSRTRHSYQSRHRKIIKK